MERMTITEATKRSIFDQFNHLIYLSRYILKTLKINLLPAEKRFEQAS